jgi:hypothetical protein
MGKKVFVSESDYQAFIEGDGSCASEDSAGQVTASREQNYLTTLTALS